MPIPIPSRRTPSWPWWISGQWRDCRGPSRSPRLRKTGRSPISRWCGSVDYRLCRCRRISSNASSNSAALNNGGFMGKGDIRSRRGKIRRGTYGVTRPKKKKLKKKAAEAARSEEHTSELQSRLHLVCRLLLEKKKNKTRTNHTTQHDAPSAPARLRQTSTKR